MHVGWWEVGETAKFGEWKGRAGPIACCGGGHENEGDCENKGDCESERGDHESVGDGPESEKCCHQSGDGDHESEERGHESEREVGNETDYLKVPQKHHEFWFGLRDSGNMIQYEDAGGTAHDVGGRLDEDMGQKAKAGNPGEMTSGGVEDLQWGGDLGAGVRSLGVMGEYSGVWGHKPSGPCDVTCG
ncbi:hypothetical protein BS47DRAFT_1368851 [Hydnum rufescens UP504]|uniref:Uncharacterized protein n=1 Tax=Hydnum rufescens UP504 TaxID=1448309 RepID=A0A9P6DMQ5_9AGAM|nr:hypothetical protein BS47DRAFT_1368851 [Hydnum rufescens UP504]